MGQSNADEATPSIGDIDTAERFEKRVALICRLFRDGSEFETERLSEAEFRERNVVGIELGRASLKVEGFRPRPFGLRDGVTIPPRLRLPRPPYNAGRPNFSGPV